MKEQPTYKSLKVPFATWQALTRIASKTGEPRSQIVERLARDEEARQADAMRGELRTPPLR